jgi:hypothetical protein
VLCNPNKIDYIGDVQMKQGVLVYDKSTDRMDVRFDVDEFYGDLHCGTTMDVYIGRWIPLRIEYGDNWFLVGIRSNDLVGLRARI